MNLVASLVARNELGRYLAPCIKHLLAFCDQVCVLDDSSDDGTREWLFDHANTQLRVAASTRSTFFEHEGHTRQRLLDWTLAHQPTHVLSIDADEFVSDGLALRAHLEKRPDLPVWNLEIEEVWKAEPERLLMREDGGWRSHPMPCLWRAPERVDGSWRILNKKLACRRVPMAVLRQAAAASPTAVSLLHFGWADESERRARHARYALHDKGRFHAGRHLASILWDDSRVTLREREWPEGEVLDGLRERFSAVAS